MFEFFGECYRVLITPNAVERDRQIVEKAVKKDLDTSYRTQRRRSGRTTTAIVERIRSKNRDIFEMDARQVQSWVIEFLLNTNKQNIKDI